MPRYYFHLHNDLDVPDEEGVELTDVDAAREYAERNAVFTMAETLKESGRLNLRHYVDIQDEQGKVLATVRFRDVVSIE
jgi:hypothetical protein